MKSWTITLAIAFTLLATACNDDSASTSNKSASIEYEELLSRLVALEEKNAQLELQLSTAEASLESVTALGSENDDRLEQMEQLLSCVTFDKADQNFIIENCNLTVRNGTGETQSQNGSGNIIIGYNEDAFNNKDRGGSHNLVIGAEHQYSAYGGLVVGENHQINSPYASITGGRDNRVSASHATIGGGANTVVNANDAWAAGDILSDGKLVRINTGFLDLFSRGAMDIESISDLTMNSRLAMYLQSSGSLELSANDMDIRSTSDIHLQGSSGLNLSTFAQMNLQGSIILLNGGSMPAARMGDQIMSVGGSGSIVEGSATVLIGN